METRKMLGVVMFVGCDRGAGWSSNGRNYRNPGRPRFYWRARLCFSRRLFWPLGSCPVIMLMYLPLNYSYETIMFVCFCTKFLN